MAKTNLFGDEHGLVRGTHGTGADECAVCSQLMRAPHVWLPARLASTSDVQATDAHVYEGQLTSRHDTGHDSTSRSIRSWAVMP